MACIIESGTGSCNRAEVDNSYRLRVRSITEPESDHASELGYRYNINTGVVTLTGLGTTSAVLYFKNNEIYDFILEALIYNLDDSVSGTDAAQIDVYFNPTGGTIVSGATDVDMNANLNLGSSKTLSVLAYKGAEGNTLTGGTQAVQSLIQPGSRAFIDLGKVIIPQGKSIGMTVTTPTLNSSLPLNIAMAGFLAHPDVIGGSVS